MIHNSSELLDITQYMIQNLHSNTAYTVVVQANGPLGSVNSTNVTFYTLPKGTACITIHLDK